MSLPKPYWQSKDGRHIVYCASCLDILPYITADACVTDIPYGEVNRESGGLRNLDKGNADTTSFAIEDFVKATIHFPTVYVWCGTEQVSPLRAGYVAAGMSTRLCIWEKTNPSVMNGQHLWLSSIECCVFARSSGAWFSVRCGSPVWRMPTQPSPLHPTQKPVALISKNVTASCPPNGIVVDGCMGSGTTGIACIKTGRRFIGVEIEEKYCKIAVDRMEPELDQPFLPMTIEEVPAMKEQKLSLE